MPVGSDGGVHSVGENFSTPHPYAVNPTATTHGHFVLPLEDCEQSIKPQPLPLQKSIFKTFSRPRSQFFTIRTSQPANLTPLSQSSECLGST